MPTWSASIEDLRPTATRIMRLARDLCGAYVADIVLANGYSFARGDVLDFAADPLVPSHRVLVSGQALWIEDLDREDKLRTRSGIGLEHRLRSYSGVPIRRPNGEVFGCLSTVAQDVRTFDQRVQNRLSELGELVVEAFERLKAAVDLDHAQSELRAALERTARSESRLRMALRLAKIQVWELDHRRKELSADGAPSALPPGADYVLASSDPWASMHPDDRPAAQALWNRHLSDGAPYQVTHRMLRPGQPHLWVEAAYEAIQGPDGQLEGLIGAIRDIDREKRNELELVKARDAAEAANRAKSAFLATMSHEIRTPLNGVLGMAQAMAADELGPRQRERLDVIRQSGEALLSVLNDILDLSKIETGKLTLETLDFDIGELAGSVHAAFAAVAERKGLAFDLVLQPSAQGYCRGDPTRVRQLLSNLVSNALKFTDAGSVTVTISRSGDRLRIEVRDTGIGIARERQAAIFQKFEQADSSTTRLFGGSGLGLSICRELALLMDGSLEVDSHEGEGSTFVVELPLAAGRKPAAREVDDGADASPDQALPALRVLAAEDNEVNQKVLKALLGPLGIEPFVVGDGLEAVAAWEAQVWDIILMDVQMPRMDGPTATRFIRGREQSQGRLRTPIIALTANAMPYQIAEYVAAGMDGYVVKPIDTNQLYAALQQALDQASPQARISES